MLDFKELRGREMGIIDRYEAVCYGAWSTTGEHGSMVQNHPSNVIAHFGCYF